MAHSLVRRQRQINPLVDNAPPRVSVELLPAAPSARTRRIRVRAESLGLPMSDVAAYVNDIPMTPSAGRALRSGESLKFVREFDVPINESDNTLRIEVFNGRSLGETEKYVPGVAAPTPPGDLYVLAVGANRFPDLDPGTTLSYSARDAEEFARAMGNAGAGRFRQVHVKTLSDSGTLPTKAAVMRALAALNVANGNDTVVVFLASHGLSDKQGNYYFVPRDATHKDIDTLLDGGSLPPVSSLVGWQEVSEALRNTAGRRLLIVDTCQARQIAGHFQDYSLIKRSASSRLAFILASKGDEESQEYEAGNTACSPMACSKASSRGSRWRAGLRAPPARSTNCATGVSARKRRNSWRPRRFGRCAFNSRVQRPPWFAYSLIEETNHGVQTGTHPSFCPARRPGFAFAAGRPDYAAHGRPRRWPVLRALRGGDILNGFDLRTGDDVDAIRPICAFPSTHNHSAAHSTRGQRRWCERPNDQIVCPDNSPGIAEMMLGAEGERTYASTISTCIAARSPSTNYPQAIPRLCTTAPKLEGGAHGSSGCLSVALPASSLWVLTAVRHLARLRRLHLWRADSVAARASPAHRACQAEADAQHGNSFQDSRRVDSPGGGYTTSSGTRSSR